MERHNLYMFRCDKKLTQAEIAAILGVSRATYSFIERGVRSGANEFWAALQTTFNVPDAEMWKLQKLDERKEPCEAKEK